MLGRDRYLDWVYRDAPDRPMSADEAEAILKQQSWCLAIASAAAGFLSVPIISVALMAIGSSTPSGAVSAVLVMSAIAAAASFGIWRFRESILVLVKHIEHFGLDPRPGWEAVGRNEKDDGTSVDPLHKAMGLEGAD